MFDSGHCRSIALSDAILFELLLRLLNVWKLSKVEEYLIFWCRCWLIVESYRKNHSDYYEHKASRTHVCFLFLWWDSG